MVCFVFVLGDVLPDFADFPSAFITLFRASQGDFNWDSFEDAEGLNPAFLLFAYIVVSVFMIIAAIVLLNLLIAMMAKTFDNIESSTISQIIFARFQMSLELSRESAMVRWVHACISLFAYLCYFSPLFRCRHRSTSLP